MERVQFGGRPSAGFGVGIAPQSTFVKPAQVPSVGDSLESAVVDPFQRKLGAFAAGALASGVAAVAATTLFGEGAAGLSGAGQRLQRAWRVLTATAVAGGIVGTVMK